MGHAGSDRQTDTRQIGDAWLATGRSAVLAVPSVISGERNFVLNPAHPDFARIMFAEPLPFRFDLRLLRAAEVSTTGIPRKPV